MDVAIIGWGSLLRNNKALNLIDGWKTDGPRFPLEFAYVSKSGLLNLVILPSSSAVPTPWGLGSFDNLEAAIATVAKLFRANIEEIGFFCKGEEKSSKRISSKMQIELCNWLSDTRLDKVIWLDRRSNFENEIKTEFSMDSAVDYIKGLGKNDALSMEKYVVSTPEQVETPIRDRLRKELGWRNLSVYREGFWLDKNTFVMCDNVSIEMVKREKQAINDRESEEVPMLILENAVKMMVKKDNKIMGEDIIPKFGIWLDDVKKLYTEQQLWLKEHATA